MRILVMGGTRLMGDATVRRLLADGHDVTVFHRGSRTRDWKASVHTVIGDRDVPEQLAKATGLDVDLVVDFSAYRGDQSRLLVDQLPAHVKIVHCSSGTVYAPAAQFPWPEHQRMGPWDLWGNYAVQKLAAETVLREAADSGRSVLVFRLPYVLGPRNYAPREEFVLNRLVDGATIAMPGDGKAMQQFITAEQVGESVARIAASNLTPGFLDVNVADPLAQCTLEGFVHICAEVVGAKPSLTHVGGGPAGSPGPFDAANCVFPFPNEPYVLGLDKAAKASLLPTPQPIRQAIQDAWAVVRAEPGRRTWTRTSAEAAALDAA